MKKIAICALAFVASAFAQFPSYPAAYPRALADTISDSSLVMWQIPPFTGTTKLRSMSWGSLVSATSGGGGGGCDNSGYTGTGDCVRATSPTITTPTLSGTTNSAKIVSSDTLAGIGIRSSNYNAGGLTAVFGGSLTLPSNTLINSPSSTAARGYTFQSPSSNWSPQESGIYFTPRDGVNAIPDFKIALWNGAGGTTNAFTLDGQNGNAVVFGKFTSNDTVVGVGVRSARYNTGGIAATFGGKLTSSDTVVGVGIRSANYNSGALAATFGGKLTSSDTVVGLGIRSANYNAGALAATFGGKLTTSDTLVAGRGVRTNTFTSSGVKSSFTGGLYGDTVIAYYAFKWTTAGASVKSAYWNGTTLASGTISGTGTTFTTTASPTFTGTVGAAKIVATDTVVGVGGRLSGLAGGSGNYVCINANGTLYRGTTCP